MSTIVESIDLDDWLARPLDFDGETYTAIVSARVTRTVGLDKGPGVSMVRGEAYKVVEIDYQFLRVLTASGFVKLNYDQAPVGLIEAFGEAVIEQAKQEPDFAWDAESNEEWSFT